METGPDPQPGPGLKAWIWASFNMSGCYLLGLLPGFSGAEQLGLVLPLLQDALVARFEIILQTLRFSDVNKACEM